MEFKRTVIDVAENNDREKNENVVDVEGGNDEGENIENVTFVESGEIKIGMQVSFEKEAYNMYNEYALKKGFSIRKAARQTVNGVVRQREFVCSKQGFKEFEDPSDVKKYNHLETGIGCCARIRFDMKNDIWTMSHFNDIHTREFASPEERCNLRSGRKVHSRHGNILSNMVGAGIKATKSYSFLAKEVGGANNLGFLRRDCHNFLRIVRKEIIEAGDGQSIINHLKKKANKCLYGNMNVMEFEATWSAMIEKHKQQNNDWLNRLYHVREKWCPSFNVDFFSAKMKYTQ
ncbi:hypothetical protein SO802_008891 [Lithocarpus litseifolius]|uniref:FAR1 domain-containing protein n=1 Tax=Lithocarpus litseifolius TaxID=425828 RepID=A0AAW2DCQ4_9ROSI